MTLEKNGLPLIFNISKEVALRVLQKQSPISMCSRQQGVIHINTATDIYTLKETPCEP